MGILSKLEYRGKYMRKVQSGGRVRGGSGPDLDLQTHIRTVSHTLLTSVPCPIPNDLQRQREVLVITKTRQWSRERCERRW